MSLVVKRLKGGNTLTNGVDESVNADSDCESEGDLTGTDGGALKDEENGGTRALLSAGSFSAYVHLLVPALKLAETTIPSWKSLFFYHCTDTISFAPLKSQGVDSRLSHIRENTKAAAPPPCSPKSIYALASLVRQSPIERLGIRLTHRTKLGIQPLCDSAFADIKSKVSSENVVDEVFSWVTAWWVSSCSSTPGQSLRADASVQSGKAERDGV